MNKLKIIFLNFLLLAPVNLALSNNKSLKTRLIEKTKNITCNIGIAGLSFLSFASITAFFKDLNDCSRYSCLSYTESPKTEYLKRLIYPAVDLGALAGFLYCAKNLNDYKNKDKTQEIVLDKEKDNKSEDSKEDLYEYEDDAGTNLIKGLATGWVGISSIIMACTSIKRNYLNTAKYSKEPISVENGVNIGLMAGIIGIAGYTSKKLFPQAYEYLKKAYRG